MHTHAPKHVRPHTQNTRTRTPPPDTHTDTHTRAHAHTHTHTRAHAHTHTRTEEARNGGVMGMGEMPPVARSSASLQKGRNEQRRKASAFEPIAAYGPPGST